MDETDPPAGPPAKAKRSVVKEVPFLVVVAVALALFMKAFIVQAFYIPSGSMEKTLHGATKGGDRVLVNKLVYRFRDIHRGDIVVFNGKGTDFVQENPIEPPRTTAGKALRNVQHWLGLGAPNEKDFIKRVIGVSGDVVACCTDGKVTVNGQPIEEPYVHLSFGVTELSPFEPKRVPEGELFVMGDHRNNSSDSRVNGTIPERLVVGRAIAVFYPFARKKVLWSPATFERPAALPFVPFVPPVAGVALATPLTVLRRKVRRRTD